MAKPPTSANDVDALIMSRAARCSERTIRDYAKMGLVVRTRPGRYALIESLGNIIVHFREKAAQWNSRDPDADPAKEKAMLNASQRRLVDLRVAEMDGRLVSIPEVEAAWSTLATAAKQMFLSFPSRARFDLPHLTGADQKVLERLAREMLAELALVGNKPVLPGGAPDERLDETTAKAA